jgi:RNA chaperone Hfq
LEINLLDKMLSAYQSEHASVTVTLQNKIRLSGKIKAFDSYIIVMEGQKREIVYRHAISCLSLQSPIEQKKTIPAPKPAELKASQKLTSVSTQKAARLHERPAFPASTADSSINSGMKEGLLKWMQGQKAAK